MKLLGLLLGALALVAPLAGCGGDDPGPARRTAANGDVYGSADVRFATDMIQHHAQALAMVDMVHGRQVSPDLTELADAILGAQVAEVEQMTTWLTDWDEPVPATQRDHLHAHGHGAGGDGDMPGMMSADEMADLEAVQGAAFEQRWLESMVEHHRGALEMAEDEQRRGVFGAAVELARSIESAQRQEIARMKAMLERS